MLQGVAAEWTVWRGPTRDARVSEPNLLQEWPKEGPTVLWRAKVGLGFSSFVVSGDRAYTLGHADEQDTVSCLNASNGQTVWKHAYPAELGDKFFEGGTTGTPTLDGDRLYTLSRWGDAFCFNAADGKVLWSTNVATLSGARLPDWGFGGAPVIVSGAIYMNVGDAGLALDKMSGALLWKSDVSNAGYSTPVVVERGGETVLLLGSGKSYVAVQARDGREVWRLRWLTEYGVNASDPIVVGDRIFLSTGYGKGAGLFEWKTGEPTLVWKSKVLRTQLNAAVHHDGFLYGVDGDTTEKASLKCVALADGREAWAFPNFGSGSVLLVNDQLLALSGTGELLMAPASPTAFKPTQRAQVLGGKCWTLPVLSGGRLLARNSRGDVVCLQLARR